MPQKSFEDIAAPAKTNNPEDTESPLFTKDSLASYYESRPDQNPVSVAYGKEDAQDDGEKDSIAGIHQYKDTLESYRGQISGYRKVYLDEA